MTSSPLPSLPQGAGDETILPALPEAGVAGAAQQDMAAPLPTFVMPEEILPGEVLLPALPVVQPPAELVEVVEEPDAAADSTAPVVAGDALPSAAEQWLLGMLGQQQAQVQARETLPADMAKVPQAELAPLPQAGAPLPVPRRDEALPVPNGSAAVAADAPEPAALPAAQAQGREALAVVASGGEQSGIALPTAPVAVHGNAPAAAADSFQPAAQPLQQHLQLQSPEAKWGEQMLGALRDSVELQLQQKTQSATIRLDPPELGSLEIFLSHDSGRLQVQISASQGDVARLLQQTSERLRQELVGQNFLQVDVQVGGDSQSGQQQHQARTRLPLDDAAVAAAQVLDTGEEAARQSAGGRDVLITV